MQKLNTIFCGTPDFSIPSLEILKNHPNINLILVVTMPDRPFGRGLEMVSPPVAKWAKENNIPLLQTENINKEEKIPLENIDLIIVLAFAQFLGEKILKLPKLGCFNIHTSLLPKYRGAAPIQYALLNGDTTTGVSIQKMVKKMDAGDIGFSKSVEILKNDNNETLFTRLKNEAANSLGEFINIIATQEISYLKQNESDVSFAPTIKKDDGFIDFKNIGFVKLLNMYRAYYNWPGIFCFIDGKRLKILSFEKYPKKLSAGLVDIKLGILLIGCIDETIRVNELQLEGKAKTTDDAFLKGYRGELKLC